MTSPLSEIDPRYGPDGLVTVVVQDASDGRILMVAHADAAALAATAASGDMHFHSRSRDRLWRKGESSGNVLHVVRLDVDCDGDAILATVRPEGPTCHRGTRSCFDVEDGAGPTDMRERHGTPEPEGATPEPEGFAWLENLWSTIQKRRRDRPAGSYTTTLLAGGVDAAGRKVTEEATEVLMAAKDDAVAQGAGRDRAGTTAALTGEAADLLYHALVLLAERDVRPADVMATLRARHGAARR